MKTKQQGFTIIELLIATTVFSVVMVICLAAFLRVGQLYYKGIYLARTQEAARNISDDIVNQLRLNGSATSLSRVGSTNIYYMCAGNMRYSFMSNNVVNSQTESSSNFGLVRDTLPSTGCRQPTAAPAGVPLAANAVEMLGDNMRVVATGTAPGQSDVSETCSPAIPKIACVHVHVEFGDNDLLVSPITNASFTTDSRGFVGGICSGPLQGSQFCATSEIKTTVYPLL